MVESVNADNYTLHWNQWRWAVPDRFNIAQQCLHRNISLVDAELRSAIVYVNESGVAAELSYAALVDRVDRLSGALSSLSVSRGDRVAICLPQCIETAVAHLAIYQLGAIAVPLTTLFVCTARSARWPFAMSYRSLKCNRFARRCLRSSKSSLAATLKLSIKAC
jgi:acetyl-CoA synthetase